MTASTIQATRTADVGSRPGFSRALLAEWTKLVTLRSTFWTLGASAAVSLIIGAGLVFGHLDFWSQMSPEERATVDPVYEGLMGLWLFGLLGFAVVGALTMTSEYGSGTIGATFAAVPRRLRVLGAKAIVVGLVAIFVATLASMALFFVTQPILARESMDVSIHDSGVALAVLGCGLYVAGSALAGLALGAIFRSTTATLVAVTSIFFLATMFSLLQPEAWSTVTQFMPQAAGMALITSIEHSDLLSPGAGFVVFAGWIATAFLVAALLLVRRDA